MEQIINQYSSQIWSIYNSNFPSYLKKPKKLFIKKLIKYDFWDLLVVGKNIKKNINNLSKLTGLNKDSTYSNLFFSNFSNSDIAGFSLFNYFPKFKILHLDYVSLAKFYQGKGNGTSYLKYLIENIFLKYQNIFSYFVLECEDHLIKFYKSLGFVKINFSYLYLGVPMNLMVWNSLNPISKLQGILIALYLQRIFNPVKFICFIPKQDFVEFTLNYSYLISKKYRFHIVDNFQKP